MASVSLSRTPALSLQRPVGHGTSTRGAVAVAGLVATQRHGTATTAIVASALAVASRNRPEKRSVARRAGKEELTPVKEAVASAL